MYVLDTVQINVYMNGGMCHSFFVQFGTSRTST